MKGLKKILLSMLAVATLVVCLALTSCGECEHQWSEWKATGAATCSGTAEQRVCSECEEVETRTNGDAAAHTWGAWTVKTAAGCITAGEEERACTKCVAKETRPIAATGHEGDVFCNNCANMIFTFPEVDFSAYDSVAIDLKDVVVTMNYPERPATSGTLTLGITKGYVKLDDNGELVGAFQANMTMTGTATELTAPYVVTGLIENGFIYLGTEGSAPSPDNNYKKNTYAKYALETVSDMDEMQQALEQVEALLPDIEEWYADFAELFADVAIDASGVKSFAIDLLNGLFVKTATTDGFTVTVDYEAIKAFNAKLAEKTIAEMFDVIAGEGAYADVKAFITSDEFFALSVADLISYIENDQGVDLVAFVDAIDALLVILSGEEEMSLIALLASQGMIPGDPTEFDLEAFLADEAMAEYSVAMALSMMLGVADDPATAENEVIEAVKEMLTPIFEQLEETTVYELLLAGGPNNEQAGPAPLSDSDEDPIAAMVEMVNGMIDQMAEMSGITIYFDKNGAFVKTVLTAAVVQNAGELNATVTITEDDVTIEIEFSEEMNDGDGVLEATAKIVPGETVEIDAAAIAKVKAAINSIPMTQQDYFNAILGELFQSDSDVYKIKDNKLTILRLINITSNNVSIAVFQFEYNENYSITVTDGCKNFYEVEMRIESTAAKGSATILGDVYWDYLMDEYFVDATNFWNTVNSVPADAWQSEYTYVDFSYDADATENKYDYADSRDYDDWYGDGKTEIRTDGHIYVLDEGKSILEANCGELLKFAYKCSKCNDEYVYFETVRHDGDESYALADEDLGLAGGFVRGLLCDACEDFIADNYVIYINSELDAVYQEYNDNNYAYIVITVEEAGYYAFYTEAEDDVYCDTAITVYEWDAANAETDAEIGYADGGASNGHCYMEKYLEAGTYLVDIHNWGVGADEYVVYIEALS